MSSHLGSLRHHSQFICRLAASAHRWHPCKTQGLKTCLMVCRLVRKPLQSCASLHQYMDSFFDHFFQPCQLTF